MKKDYIVNNYRSKNFGNKYFVTTDNGSCIVLSEEEFKAFKSEKITDKLFKKLEEREIILTKKNVKEDIKNTKKRNLFLFSGASLHIIVPTLRCRMKCRYCHASSVPINSKGYDMDKKTAKKTIDFIFQSPSDAITIEFQGGEPLLNWPVVRYIIDYALAKNKTACKDLVMTIVTNFVEMDMKKLSYLIDKGVRICTSLDGPKELHDYNRVLKGGSNYEQIVKWTGILKEEYKKRGIKRHPDALITLTKKSLGYPKEIVDEYVKIGIRELHLRFLNRIGVAQKNWDEIGYSVEDYINFWKKAVGYISELKKKGVDISEKIINIMYKKMSGKEDPNYTELRTPCGAAIGQIVYNYDGNIYSCDEARMIGDDLFLLGNVKKDNYKDILTSGKVCSIVLSSINNNFVCNECVYQPYCGICPVCNYVEQGSIIGKISQTNRCKIFKQQFDWVVTENFIKKEGFGSK
jgi:His-Xaa-Ser system radical SAM maturase HxsB